MALPSESNPLSEEITMNIVSKEDREWANSVSVHIDSHGYPAFWKDGRKQPVHREIARRMGLDIEGMQVDHINGIKHDNRRENIRVATPSQNQQNRRRNKNNKSGHRGVSWSKAKGKWHVRTMLEGKQHHLGYFDDIKDAVDARQAFVEEHYSHYEGRDLDG